jgi:glycosyltransferase involved in cell wall biosynthesis
VDLSVVVPAYQAAGFAAARLGALAENLAASGLEHEILVVDDGSRDGTGAVLRSLGLPRLKVLSLHENRGKYAAIKHGIAQAQGSCCLIIDADVPYDLSAVGYMAALVNERGFDLVIGDRTLPGSVYQAEMSWVRRALTRVFTVLVRLFHTGGVADTQCGIKAFRREVAHPLFALLREERFAGDLELLYIALKYNLALRRVPVRLVFHGPSRVRPLFDGPRLVAALAAMRWRYWRGAYESEELRRLARQDYWSADGPRG